MHISEEFSYLLSLHKKIQYTTILEWDFLIFYI
jgi:hypothetical protein